MNYHTFTPLYSLLVPLQNTTSEMGPTAVCPGSHRCYYTPACFGFGSDFDDNTTEQVGFQVVDSSSGHMAAGSGLLYSSSTMHRGTGHSEGPDRVVLILSFAGRPDHNNRPGLYSRFPPLDSVYGIRWHQMGHSLSDFSDPYKQMSFSLTKWTGFMNMDSKLAWTSFRFDLFRAANPDQYRFRAEDLKMQKDQSKGLMGILSSIFFVDVHPPPRTSTLSDTEYHAIRLLNRIREACLAIFAVLLTTYLLFVGFSIKPRSIVTLTRLVVLALVLCGLAELARYKIGQSDWASDILAGSIAAGPPEMSSTRDIVQLENYDRNLPTPVVQDVLVESLPTKLAAHAHILDYLPGNRRWRSIAHDQSKFYLLYDGLPRSFRQAVVNHVISMTRSIATRTFYEKNIFGDFVQMTDETLRRRTRDLILEQVLRPNNRLRHLTDKIRCKEGGARTLCQSTPQVIQEIFQQSGELSAPSTKTSSNAQVRGLFVQKHAMQYPWQTTESCAPAEASPRKTWEVGDVVQAQMRRAGTYPSRKWVNVEIIKKSEHNMYDLKGFNVDGERLYGVHGSLLRQPHQTDPDDRTFPGLAFSTLSGPTSMATCKLPVLNDEQACDRSSLSLSKYNVC